MENSKAKNVIIIILIILLLGCLGIFVWQYIKTTDSINNNYSEGATNVVDNTQNNQQITDDKQEGNTNLPQEGTKVEDNEDNEDKQDQTTNKPEDTNKVDPYANYKNVEWCGKKYSGRGQEFKIQDGKLFFDGKQIKLKTTDKLKSVASYIGGGVQMGIVLTESGDVYYIELCIGCYNDGDTVEAQEELKEYDIIDMTTELDDVVDAEAYFLTSEGDLLDRHGNTYNDLNKNFVSSLNHWAIWLYMDNNENLYYPKKLYADKVEYESLKNTLGRNVQMQEVLYIQNEKIIVITKEKEVIYLNTDSENDVYIVTQEQNKVKEIQKNENDYILIMEDYREIKLDGAMAVTFE